MILLITSSSYIAKFQRRPCEQGHCTSAGGKDLQNSCVPEQCLPWSRGNAPGLQGKLDLVAPSWRLPVDKLQTGIGLQYSFPAAPCTLISSESVYLPRKLFNWKEAVFLFFQSSDCQVMSLYNFSRRCKIKLRIRLRWHRNWLKKVLYNNADTLCRTCWWLEGQSQSKFLSPLMVNCSS